MRGCEPGAKGELCGRPVDTGDVRVRHQRHRGGPGEEVGERRERARADPDAPGGEHDVFDVVGMCIGHLVVELAAPLVECPELGLVLRQRTIAAGASLPRGLHIDLEQDGQRAVPELVPDRGGLHRSSAKSDHGGVRQA